MRALLAALRNSCAGLAYALRAERAVRQEAALLILALPAVFWIAEAGWLRMSLLLALVAMLCVELLNTALEKLCDRLAPERDDAIRAVKDMGSAACLCAQAAALALWLGALAARLWPG